MSDLTNIRNINKAIFSTMNLNAGMSYGTESFNAYSPQIYNFLCGDINFSDKNTNFNFFSNKFPTNINTPLFNFTSDFPKFDLSFNNNFSYFNTATIKKSDNSNTTESKVKYMHWTKMDDAKMRKFFGNYDYDITKNFTGTAEDLNKFLEKYPTSELRGKGKVFIDAQNKYNISALVLLAICGTETSYGTQGKAIKRHNFACIEKEKGATYDGRWRKFDSAEECIMELARLLRENYVDSPGEGKVAHLKKLYQIGPKYCPAKEDGSGAGWARNVQACMNSINKVINS